MFNRLIYKYQSCVSGISFFFWTSIHNFFHILDAKCPVDNLGKIMKTIQTEGKNPSITLKESLGLMPLNSEDLDDLDMETNLVEQAAMAWIARAILESGDEYVTDPQFNQYLAIKATMELRQILKDIDRGEAQKKARNMTFKKRPRKYLPNHKRLVKQQKSKAPKAKGDAFEYCESFSTRDPIRKMPLQCCPKKNSRKYESIPEEVEVVNDQLSSSPSSRTQEWVDDQLSTMSDIQQENRQEKSVEIQTDPLSPEMVELFNELEKRQSDTNA